MLSQRKYEDTFGHLVPYLRIKDYVLKRDEILMFSLECKDFLPTITLHVSTATKSLSRENMPVDGDRVSVGIRMDKSTFKPISSDFIITSITNSPHKDNLSKKRGYYEYFIKAKLFIPNLDNGLENFTYVGYAEEALKEACKRLGLGYIHTKNVRTATREAWHCYHDPLEFIQDVTRHMWLAKDSFFDSWIDPRRNLTVVNVNDLLGRKLADDGELDFTKYKNVNGSVGEDGKYVNNDLMKLKDTKFPKLYCNDPQFEDSMWYPITYQYVNNSTNVSKALGPQRNFEIYVQNNGVGQSIKEARHIVEIGVWYMQEKLDLGYVIANGPTNYAKDFQMASNGNWRDENTKRFPPILMPIWSDPDQETHKADQSNLRISGNFSKEYTIAPEHNLVNLAELDKQEVILTTNGANLGIMKGEKVPCFLYNRSNEKWVSETRNTQDTGFEFDMVCSGWFYVKGVELLYKPDFNQSNFITDWKTIVTLTRREWFPPESTSTKHEASEFGILEVDTAGGTSIESVSQPSNDVNANISEVLSDSNPEEGFDSWISDLSDQLNGDSNELGGMFDEIKDNLSDFEQTMAANGILGSLSNLTDAIDGESDILNALKDSMNSVTGQFNLLDIPGMIENGSSSVQDALTSLDAQGLLSNLMGEDSIIGSDAEGLLGRGLSFLQDNFGSFGSQANNLLNNLSSQGNDLLNGALGSLGMQKSALLQNTLASISGEGSTLLQSMSSKSKSFMQTPLKSLEDTSTSIINDPISAVSSQTGTIIQDTLSALEDKKNSLTNSLLDQGNSLLQGTLGALTSQESQTISNTLSASNISQGISSMLSSAASNVSSLEDIKNSLSSNITALSNDVTAQSQESIKNGIPLGAELVDSAKEKLSEITAGAESLVASLKDSLDDVVGTIGNDVFSNLDGINDIVGNLQNLADTKIGEISNYIDDAKNCLQNITSPVEDTNEGELSLVENIQDASVDVNSEEFAAAMAYDANGLKHFMNEFIGCMNADGIPYIMKGTRRWALDPEDNKVYGNAFTMRETSEIYKTLDSDGIMYWLSDYNSRHYYGEAVDIEPATSFDDLLEKMCLAKRTLDCMHKYGICVQLEVSKSGHSKGTHFHCSTEHDNSQAKWWGIVNKRRLADKLNTYVTILAREYYEKETKNDIVIV